MDRNARIYVAFSSAGLFGSTQTYSLHHPDSKVLSNEEILDEIRRRCEGVEFVGTTEVEKAEYTVANVQAQGPDLDGLLYFGSLPAKLTGLGLPTLAVFPLWGQWQYPFDAYKGRRTLTATLPIIPDASPSTFSARLDSIAAKIRLMRTAARLKRLRVLCVTDRPALGAYEPTASQIAEEGRETYERNYLQGLAALGTSLVVRPQQEMISRMEASSDEEAKEIARDWIAKSADVKGTNEQEIRKSARLYLAMKGMLADYDAAAITTEGYGIFMNYPGGPIPSQGLPSSQFCTDGIVATSETLVDSLLTQQLGFWLTGSTGFNGDYIVDEGNGKAYIGHCECPFNPRAEEEWAPYVIRNLPQWPVDQQEKGGACVQVDLPTGEPVTVAKISVHDRKLSLFTGEAVAGGELFPGWEDLLCRTKLAIAADAKKLLEKLDWRTFGNHRVVFYGDHRDQFKELATLIGFQAVEKDR